MTDPARWAAADALIDEALGLPPERREAFLRERTGHDPALFDLARAVIREASATDAFLAPDPAVASAVVDALEDAGGEPVATADVLAPGAEIQQYVIDALIGRGGMGEVYRARDGLLGRTVALKVVPQRFATDPDRLGRFRREARVLASLSHPGIGAIYGIAKAGPIEALVLEYVEGRTLAERIAEGPLPVAEVLRIARRLVDALDAAHARGILHRDLKPANIKLGADGSVKVLDFGLAKALDSATDAVETTDLTGQSPGMLLGTAAYMSPEQVRRQALDQRADIWAFGCVVFEMLTGSRAFPATSLPDVLARVLEREPAYSLLPAETPAALRRLLRRALEKDPERRLGYIGDARLDLDDAAQAPFEDEPAAPVPAGRPWGVAAAAGLAVGVLLAGTAALLWRQAPASETPPVTRYTISLDEVDPVFSYQPMLAIAPDGQTVAYRGRANGTTRVYLRHAADLAVRVVEGTEGATGLFFSPDGQWLGFDSDGMVKRVAVAGGTPVAVGPAPGGVTATWANDDTIVLATNTGRVLERLPLGGGPATPLTTLDSTRGDTLHMLPQALPDGRRVLFTIVAGRAHHVGIADLATGGVTVVAEGTHGRYLAPETLLFVRQGTLFGQHFDVEAGEVSGPAVPLVDGVATTDSTVGHFDAAAGALAFVPAGQVPAPKRELVWLDRNGRATPIPAPPQPFTRIALSPDGSKAAVGIDDPDNADIWVVDLARGTSTRLTSEPTIDSAPVWSPDGRWIAFRSERESPGLFRRDALGAGPIEQISSTDGPIHSPSAWSPDSATLFFSLFRSYTRQAVAAVTPPDRTVRVLLDGDFAQFEPQLSPDGRWLAYQSSESGRIEVMVRPYPDVTSGRWQISTAGGSSPRWSPDGRELLFLDGTGLASMPVTPGATFTVARTRRLFEIAPWGTRLGADYEISPDGRRFLFVLDQPPPPRRPTHLVVVQHWGDEVRRRVAEGR